MTKLNQIVAVVKGKKSQAKEALTSVYHSLQKRELFDGHSRHYESLEENGEELPEEQVKLRYDVPTAIHEAKEALSDLLNVTAIQDWGNTHAVADVVVDGNVLMKDVPATYLLFLEKQLDDIGSLVNKLPVLDLAYDWKKDSNRGCYSTDQFKKNRTIKRDHYKEVSPATEQHPAQIAKVTEDVHVGTYTTVKFSGAIPADEKKDMLRKVRKVKEAVKFAREQANLTEVDNGMDVANPVLDYVFTSVD